MREANMIWEEITQFTGPGGFHFSLLTMKMEKGKKQWKCGVFSGGPLVAGPLIE